MAISLRKAAIAFAPAVFALSAVRADVTVSSDPVGFYRIPLVTGYQMIGVTLVKSPVLSTLIDASTASTVTSSEGSVDVGSLLDPAKEYYLEVVEGPASVEDEHVGHRLEVDVAATIDAATASGVVVIDPAHERNTAFPAPDLSGYRFELRPHITLGESFDKDQLHGSLQLSKCDQVQFFNGSSFKPYYLFAQSNEPGALKIWGEFNFTSAEDKVIPPGVGLVFKRSDEASSSADLIITGRVRTNPFYQLLEPGFNFVAEPYPITTSFTGREAFPAQFTPNFSISKADQLQVFNGSSFTIYYLAGTAANHAWLLTTNLTVNQNDTELFDYRHPVFFRMQGPALNYRVPLTWTP